MNPDAVKLPREEKAERGIICFLYHNPEKLSSIKTKLQGEFVTNLNKRIFEFLENICADGAKPDLALFNESFTGAEMGRIREITEDKTFAYDETALGDFIKVLNDYKESAQEKSAVDMTDSELRLFAESLKEKR